jgi:hypothetical protein
VLIVEVDRLDAQSLERSFARLADVLGTAIDAPYGRIFGSRTLPNLVAMITRSRFPLIARPTSSSFLNGPYMSAVSSMVMPSSSARWMVAMDSFSLLGP